MKIGDFRRKKESGQKISMVTSYDYWSAKIINETDVDCVLVGDSLSMVMYGHSSTLPATPEMMRGHTEAVSRGAKDKFIISDMPFLSTRKGLENSMDVVDMLLKAGANAVKIEGIIGHERIIEHIVKSDIPVMGHLGLTPQSIHKLGGHKVQAKSLDSENTLLEHALKLEELGVFSIVLECIPAKLSKKVTESLGIPTIGIGAGQDVDGQVLVLQDILGMDKDFNPKFLRKYLDGFGLITKSLNEFHSDVVNKNFPRIEESY